MGKAAEKWETYAEHLSRCAKEARAAGDFDEMNRCLNLLCAGSPADYERVVWEMMADKEKVGGNG